MPSTPLPAPCPAPAAPFAPRRLVPWLLVLAAWAPFAGGCAAGAQSYLRASAAPARPPSMAEAAPSAPGSEEPPPAAPEGAPSAAQSAMASAIGSGPGRNTTPASGSENRATPPENPPANPANAPLLIYIAQVDMQVEAREIPTTLDQIADVAHALGGYLARRNDTSVQVRVPSARFREGLARMERLGEVLHRSVSAEDVSEEYRDIEVRLQNLRAIRARLEQLLAQAHGMQEVLTVERELERVTREIDTLQGRLRFLAARVSFSLVTVNLHPRPAPVVVVVPPETPQRRVVNLPVEWLSRLGIDRLLELH